MIEHKCPRCSQLTTGSISDDGEFWPVCEECMHAEERARARLADDLQQRRLLREQQRRSAQAVRKRAV